MNVRSALQTSKISQMDLKVAFSEDPAFVLSRAGVFLSSQPVRHNLVLSVLHLLRVLHKEIRAAIGRQFSGKHRCWRRTDQSPVTYPGIR